jgi:hypothetical protein
VAIGPRISATPLTAPAGTAFTVMLSCTPRLRPLQQAGVRLLFGDTELVPDSVDTPVDPTAPSSIQFTVPVLPQLVVGAYLLRLRVDGIDSLPVIATGSPPVFSFDPGQTVQLT